MSESIYDHISENIILVDLEATYEQARQLLVERGGDPQWALLVRMGDGALRGCRFSDLRQWRVESGRGKADLPEMLADAGSPLLPVTVLDEDEVNLQDVQQFVHDDPGRLLAFSYLGTITGVFRPASRSTSTAPAGIVQPVGQTEPAITAESGQGAQVPGRRWQGLRAFYQKYRIGFIVTIFWFLLTLVVQYIIPLATTNISDVFPTLFPKTMIGEWNIVVTGFIPLGERSVSGKDAQRISEVFYNHFAGEISALGGEIGVAVEMLGPRQSPPIRGKTAEEREQAAARLAERMHADVMIYGTIERSGDVILLRPEFYINARNFQEAEEIVGQHRLGSDIQILGGENLDQSQITLNRELSRRSQVLALISQGLGLLFTHQYEPALGLFEAANDDRLWEFNSGREVIYLFQGNAAGKANQLELAEQYFRKALQINPDYGRAYVGLGSVHYGYSLQGVTNDAFNPDLEHLELALDYYREAEQAEGNPESANIPTKVAFGRGHVYTMLWLMGREPAEKAIEQFQLVIDEYAASQDAALREIASEAHGRMGLIARQSNGLPGAIEHYQQALELATNPARRAVYWMTIGDLHMEANPAQVDLAEETYRTAIQEYQSAMRLTTQLERRADYWSSIASCYQKLGESQGARSALQQALGLLPQDSPKRSELESSLQSLGP